MKNKLRMAASAVVAALALIQFIPVHRANPPVTADLDARAKVKAILVAACYDCHSHQTRWPAYSRLAPVSWLIASDVREGREHLDFSKWGEYPEGGRDLLRANVWKMVSEGEMPPLLYRLMHSEARLAPAALQVLKEWCAPAAPAGGSPHM